MEMSHWLETVGIVQIHTGNQDHDGYIEVHLGASLNHRGVQALERDLKAMLKGVDEVFGSGQTLKVITGLRDGRQLTRDELQRVAQAAIRVISTWATECVAEDIVAYTTSSDASIATATHSSGNMDGRD